MDAIFSHFFTSPKEKCRKDTFLQAQKKRKYSFCWLVVLPHFLVFCKELHFDWKWGTASGNVYFSSSRQLTMFSFEREMFSWISLGFLSSGRCFLGSPLVFFRAGDVFLDLLFLSTQLFSLLCPNCQFPEDLRFSVVSLSFGFNWLDLGTSSWMEEAGEKVYVKKEWGAGGGRGGSAMFDVL